MPRFLCYCPDYPDHLEQRLSVRTEHLALAKADLESGLQERGSPFLPPVGSKNYTNPPEGKPNIGGSYMIYNFDTREQCLERLKSDPYYTAGVWDKERMRVEQLLN